MHNICKGGSSESPQYIACIYTGSLITMNMAARGDGAQSDERQSDREPRQVYRSLQNGTKWPELCAYLSLSPSLFFWLSECVCMCGSLFEQMYSRNFSSSATNAFFKPLCLSLSLSVAVPSFFSANIFYCRHCRSHPFLASQEFQQQQQRHSASPSELFYLATPPPAHALLFYKARLKQCIFNL